MVSPSILSVALLLFGSGFCALVYQVAWLRELRLIFGASTAASAAVLAVFMGGLGAGSLLSGRFLRNRKPLTFYAHLELAIAASAAVTPLWVRVARWLYGAVGGTVVLGLGGGTVVRLILAALVLSVPTMLMGGTMPACAQAIETDGDLGRRRLATLYGANTLGAVLGALSSTFILLEVFGTRRMLWSACLINALVALVARRLAHDEAAPPQSVALAAAPAAPTAAHSARAHAPSMRFVLLASALSGFGFLLMELVWYRMLGPLLGGSSFTFGLILAIALLGIGLGGIAYALLGANRPATLAGFALTCAAEALCIIVPFALGDRLAIVSAILRPLGSVGFFGIVLGWAAVTAVVVFPAALIAGIQFPLLVALLGQGRAEVGRQVGLCYAANTGGAIIGSLSGGFGLLPLLSAPGAWRLVATVLGAVGLGAALLAVRRERLVSAAPLVLSLLAFALVGAPGPSAAWRHSGIGVGRAPDSGTPNTWLEWANLWRRNIAWATDGVESSVALHTEGGYAFVVNGKIDGNARTDADTQVMSALIGAIAHPKVRRSLVVGLGTGSTAGWLGVVPSMERVDVVELEPAILRVARDCAPVNLNVLENAKVHTFIGDAREVLLTTPARYDLIFSEPSNPYRAGIASLYTQEFYQAALARLNDGGVFVQWFQTYDVDAQTVRSIYATLASVFPAVESWVTEEADLILVASKQPLVYDLARLRAKIAEEPFKSALMNAWRCTDIEGYFAHFVATDGLARAIAPLEQDNLNTDDQTLVEFGFARAVSTRAERFNPNQLREVARLRHDDRPQLTGGELDWSLVSDRQVSMLATQRYPAPAPLLGRLPEAARRRADAIAKWLSGDRRAALGEWRAQAAAPADMMQQLVAADSLAEAGDEAALPLITEMRPAQSFEADAVLARLRFRQGRLDEAASALASAFQSAHASPWALPMALVNTLQLTAQLILADRRFGARLYPLLRTPFAVALMEEERRSKALAVANATDFRRYCSEALAAFEPYPVWQRSFLIGRLRCYVETGNPLAARALRDLERFSANEPSRFETGLVPESN
jgi:spermidine synthase